MKLIFLALFALAAAEPEADPQLFYNYGAYPYAYNVGAYSAYNAYPYAYGAYPYTYRHFFKREAEAEAKPQVFSPYTYTYPYATYAPYAAHYVAPTVTKVEYKAPEMKEMKVEVPAVHYAAPAVHYAAPYAYTHPYTYTHHVAAQVVPRYHAKSAEGVEHTVFKREAEADPQFLYNYNYPYTYNYAAPYAAYTYAAPYAYNYGAYPYGYYY